MKSIYAGYARYAIYACHIPPSHRNKSSRFKYFFFVEQLRKFEKILQKKKGTVSLAKNEKKV